MGTLTANIQTQAAGVPQTLGDVPIHHTFRASIDGREIQTWRRMLEHVFAIDGVPRVWHVPEFPSEAITHYRNVDAVVTVTDAVKGSLYARL